MADARTDFFDSADASPDDDARTAFFASDKAETESKANKSTDTPTGWWEKIKGAAHAINSTSPLSAIETGAHFATGAIGGLGGGLNYLGALAATGGDTNAAQSVQEGTQQALTYDPRTQAGQQMTGAVGGVLNRVEDAKQDLADRNFEATGSPGWSAAVRTLPDAAMSLVGMRSMGAARGAGEVPAPAPRIEPTIGLGDSPLAEIRTPEKAAHKETALFSRKEVDPSSLDFRESEQNRIHEVKELFPEGEGYFPAVTIREINGKNTILDGHNRASVASGRGDKLPIVQISRPQYESLKSKGFDDMEIAYATLSKAGENDAASGLSNQFPGSGILRNGMKAESALDDIEKMIPSPQAAPGSLMNSKQSMGAAAAAPDLNNISPELRQSIRQAAQKSGGAVNQDALARHVEADTLPVPVRLTEGQALQDPHLISDEMNKRGKHQELASRFNEQNGQLVQNIQAIRDQVGPDVFSTNPVEHADTLIDAYKTKDTALREDISAKYQALRDANGGDFPVDGVSFANSADAALKRNMKRPFLPSGIRSMVDEFKDGEPMTFENFENLRTTLAAEARKAERSGDGNAAAAVNMVRDTLESLPMPEATGPVKALADEARTAARARFQALERDPAYKAAVNDTVSPDQFINKFIIKAPRDQLAVMRNEFADNPAASQTIGVAALDHLRKSAGIDSMGNGNFTQAGFNKNLEALSPKLDSLVDPRTAEQLQALGNVARYTQFQPKGSYVNHSNTATALIKEHAAGAVEGAINYAAHGLPVGSFGRKILGNRSAAKAVNQSLSPGAGLNRLSDIASPR